jgi:hypothetical protein
MENKFIGSKKISEVYPHLKELAHVYGLKLNNVKHFKMLRLLLVNLYNSEL